jgi:aspartate 1-decarboxylase
MFRFMCKSKIHRAKITKLSLHYQGSIGLDEELLERADILPGEIVQVLNLNNGERFETYTIAEQRGSGAVVLYGPAARLGEVGDLIMVISYVLVEGKKRVEPILVILDDRNRPEEEG